MHRNLVITITCAAMFIQSAAVTYAIAPSSAGSRQSGTVIEHGAWSGHPAVPGQGMVSPRFNRVFDKYFSSAMPGISKNLEHIFVYRNASERVDANSTPNSDLRQNSKEPVVNTMETSASESSKGSAKTRDSFTMRQGSMFLWHNGLSEVKFLDSKCTMDAERKKMVFLVELGQDAIVCNLTGNKSNDVVVRLDNRTVEVPIGKALILNSTTKENTEVNDLPLARCFNVDDASKLAGSGSVDLYQGTFSYVSILDNSPQLQECFNSKDPVKRKVATQVLKYASIYEARRPDLSEPMKGSNSTEAEAVVARGSDSSPSMSNQPVQDASSTTQNAQGVKTLLAAHLMTPDLLSALQKAGFTQEQLTYFVDPKSGSVLLSNDYNGKVVPPSELLVLRDVGFTPEDLFFLSQRWTAGQLLTLRHDGYTPGQLIAIKESHSPLSYAELIQLHDAGFNGIEVEPLVEYQTGKGFVGYTRNPWQFTEIMELRRAGFTPSDLVYLRMKGYAPGVLLTLVGFKFTKIDSLLQSLGPSASSTAQSSNHKVFTPKQVVAEAMQGLSQTQLMTEAGYQANVSGAIQNMLGPGN